MDSWNRLVLCTFATVAIKMVASDPVGTIVCAERCVEANHCCEGLTAACNKPSCAMGCIFYADTNNNVSECKNQCQLAGNVASCAYHFNNTEFDLCGTCPQIPTVCGCPTATECEFGCELADGAPVPPAPAPPPTPVPQPLQPCTTDYNCSFNGECDLHSGRCNCDNGWTGRFCHELDLLPVVNGTGLNRLFSPDKTSSWGGSVAYDGNGSWHMWASEIKNHCGIHRWVSNSQVVHAVSDSPTGAFVRKEVVFTLFSHEPVVARAPTGEFVLFITHHDNPPTSAPTCNCTDGTSASGEPGCAYEPSNCKNGSGCTMYTYMSYSMSPYGPWSKLVLLPLYTPPDPYTDMNFSPVILSNGSLFGWNRWGLFRANDWKDPSSYESLGGGLRPGLAGIGEDPFLWVDKKGRFHMLSHSGERGEPGPNGDCGRHFFSESGDVASWDQAPLHDWEYGGCAYYREQVRFADGIRRTFYRRERPHLVFHKDGFTPAALTTGVIDCPTSPYLPGGNDAAYTLLQAIQS